MRIETPFCVNFIYGKTKVEFLFFKLVYCGKKKAKIHINETP